jgi:4-hydroxybenzoate polyprenyltransferase
MDYWTAVIHFMRLDRPTGTLLLAYPTLFALAQQTKIIQTKTIIVLIGIVLTRSLGCMINDFSDRDIDGLVERTKNRPLALVQGPLSHYNALVWILIIASLSLSLLYAIPYSAFSTIAITALSIVVYPTTKRWFLFPQFFLALSFSSSILVVYAIFEKSLDQQSLILFIANSFWVMSFDTFYALSDLDDDEKLPVYSLPKTLGKKMSIRLAQCLLIGAHCLFLSLHQSFFIIQFTDFLSSTLVLIMLLKTFSYQKNNSMQLFHMNVLLGLLWCLATFLSR